jgi:Leucine-rich repeat (LRR) protein
VKKIAYSLEEALKQPEQVEGLFLSGKQVPPLSDQLGLLKNLTSLSIRYTSLTQLPEAIGDLKQLRHLNLNNNKLVELPGAIGELPELISLTCSRNVLKNLPDSVGKLCKLDVLTVADNALEEMPNTIGGLQGLRILNAGSNQLKELPSSIGKLTNLQQLFLAHNQIEALPPSIGNLSRLISLNLSFNFLTRLPASFGQLSSLQQLWLDANPFHHFEPVFEQLALLPHLHTLSLRQCSLSEWIPDENRLGMLVARSERIELPSMAALSSLTHLDLRQNRFTTLPSSVLELAQLKQLNLDGNPIQSLRADVILQRSSQVTIQWPASVQAQFQELDRMIRRFNQRNTPEPIRMAASFLYLKQYEQAQRWLKAQFSITQLISLVDSGDVRLRKAVQTMLHKHLPDPFRSSVPIAKSIFYIAGALEIYKKEEIIAWLQENGATVAENLNKQVTHIVAGVGCGPDFLVAYAQKTRIVFESDWVHLMESQEKSFLRDNSPDALEMAKNVRELLISPEAVNVMIGLQTLVAGGVPASLTSFVLGLFLCHYDLEIRLLAGQLFKKYVSLSLQAYVRTYWRTNYSERPEHAIRQGYLHEILLHPEVNIVDLILMAGTLTGTSKELLEKYSTHTKQTERKTKNRFWIFWESW